MKNETERGKKKSALLLGAPQKFVNNLVNLSKSEGAKLDRREKDQDQGGREEVCLKAQQIGSQ